MKGRFPAPKTLKKPKYLGRSQELNWFLHTRNLGFAALNLPVLELPYK